MAYQESPSTQRASFTGAGGKPTTGPVLVSAPVPADRRSRPTYPPGPPRLAGVLRGLLSAARPKQWLKSALVPAAPAAANVALRPHVLFQASVATVGFTVAAAGGYLLNDVHDVAADRLHARKCRRSIAAGQVPVPVARAAGLALLGTAVGGTLVLSGLPLAAVIAAYVALTFAYSAWLKRIPVLEFAVVASGFVLRPIAGAVAAGVPMSQWFLLVAAFGSLFVVVGKRYAEVTSLPGDVGLHRSVLRAYPVAYLRQVRDVCAAVMLVTYGLWAFQRPGHPLDVPWLPLSMAPVTLGVFRYGLLIETGAGGAPEDLVSDPMLLGCLGVWLVLFGLGVVGVGGA